MLLEVRLLIKRAALIFRTRIRCKRSLQSMVDIVIVSSVFSCVAATPEDFLMPGQGELMPGQRPGYARV